jgi:hypothetical protein
VIYEQRTYTCHPGKLQEFIDTYEREGVDLQMQVLGNLVGYFTTEIGPLNQAIHIWAFDSFEVRLARRAELWSKPEWLDFAAKVNPMLSVTESKIMLPTKFSPLK